MADPLSAGLMTTSDFALEKGEGHPLISREIAALFSWWCFLGAFVDCLDVGLQGGLPVDVGSPSLLFWFEWVHWGPFSIIGITVVEELLQS